MADKTIIILGGGVGGLVASTRLKEKLGDKADVVLIDRKKQFQFPPSYPWLMLGMREADQVQRDLGLLKKKKVDVVNDEVLSIKPDEKVVKTGAGDLLYDYLVVALGAECAPESIPGFSGHANHIYDLDSAIKFRREIEKFAGGTIAIGISRTPFKCPAAPYEVALLLEDYYRRRGMRDAVKLEFFTPEPAPLQAAGPEIGGKVIELLRSRGISYNPKLKVQSVERAMLYFEGGERTMPFDLLFCVPPHRAPKPVVDAGLTNETGWIPVNPKTLQTKYTGVYAVGDVTSIQTPSGNVPFLPKAGVFASGHAEVVSNNIAAEISKRGRMKEWDGYGACFLEIGGGQSAFVRGNFMAEPKPQLEFHMPGRVWHMQKVLFEKYWMRHWF